MWTVYRHNVFRYKHIISEAKHVNAFFNFCSDIYRYCNITQGFLKQKVFLYVYHGRHKSSLTLWYGSTFSGEQLSLESKDILLEEFKLVSTLSLQGV